MPPSADDEIITPEAREVLAAAGVHVDRSTITRWVAQGLLVPTRKLPGRTGAYLFRRSDVEALAAERAAAQTAGQLDLDVSA